MDNSYDDDCNCKRLRFDYLKQAEEEVDICDILIKVENSGKFLGQLSYDELAKLL